MAAAAQAEARLQHRFRDLEAAEAAAEAEEEAAAAERGGGWGRGLLGTWFGGVGAAAAAAAAGYHGGPPLPRAATRGPRSQRGRRGPAAEAEFAGAVASGALFGGPPMLLGGGGRGGRFGGALQQLMSGLHRGLPPELLLSSREFTEADYEQLLALDAGVQRRNLAPRDRVAQLETVRVPQRAAAAPPSPGLEGSGGGSPQPHLGTCAICLEDARPGDSFRVRSFFFFL